MTLNTSKPRNDKKTTLLYESRLHKLSNQPDAWQSKRTTQNSSKKFIFYHYKLLKVDPIFTINKSLPQNLISLPENPANVIVFLWAKGFKYIIQVNCAKNSVRNSNLNSFRPTWHCIDLDPWTCSIRREHSSSHWTVIKDLKKITWSKCDFQLSIYQLTRGNISGWPRS